MSDSSRRTNLELQKIVIQYILNNRGHLKISVLIRKCNLSFKYAYIMIKKLVENGFVIIEDKEYSVTELGIQRLKDIERFLEESKSLCL